MKTLSNQRLLALDVLRGMTIAGMILVNNPGSWNAVYTPLQHAQWDGLTPTDLVFPFFMFIMGISTYMSLGKCNFTLSKNVVLKILRRTIIIFAIGLAITWFGATLPIWCGKSDIGICERLSETINIFGQLRILGVMQRLALTYGVTAFIALMVKHRTFPYIIATLLVGYSFLLLLGNGYAYNESNILSVVDRAVLGINHMYRDNGIDPEGLLSTIPAIAHVMLGFYIGKLLVTAKTVENKIQILFIAGAILTFLGFTLSYGLPINKKIWSPTFVLVTCGMASTLLGLLIWVVDIKKRKAWSSFFVSFGVNPLFLYVLGAFLSICFGSIALPYGEENISIHGYLYGVLIQPLFGDYLGSLVYALLFVGINWVFSYPLYRRRIYIKI